METVLPIIIATLRKDVFGQVSDRNRIIDALLDMRLDHADDAQLCALVDELLGGLPGLTVVPNEWWIEALDRLEAHDASEPTAV